LFANPSFAEAEVKPTPKTSQRELLAVKPDEAMGGGFLVLNGCQSDLGLEL